MIWPFNFAQRKGRKLLHAQIMVTGYRHRLGRIRQIMNSDAEIPYYLLDDEVQMMRKVAEWEQQVRQLGGEVKP